jgi:alpha-methylacyl-CoA racemase
MGPLEGVRIVEFAGIGPGPFAGMMLADMGAEILRIDRKAEHNPGAAGRGDPQKDIPSRGRKSITLDLKKPGATETALRLIDGADGLIEGFRPGVMERLGLGPDDCFSRNARLVYGRMTGWGQDGPLAKVAGHDMNYISLSGALWSIGEADRDPVPPLNLLGDFGAGGMMLAYGMVCALLKAQRTGTGDVVDAAICDGTAALMAPIYAQLAKDTWVNERQANRLDGAAPYYRVYKCSDGKWVSLAPLEPQFFEIFLKVLELPAEDFTERLDPANWPAHNALFADIFLTKSRDEWCELMEGTDICFSPILDLEESPDHAHNKAREVFVDAWGVTQPAPAPRFVNSPVEMPGPPPAPGEHRDSALQGWGFDDDEVAELIKTGVM